jgi:hypothetical protein
VKKNTRGVTSDDGAAAASGWANASIAHNGVRSKTDSPIRHDTVKKSLALTRHSAKITYRFSAVELNI